MDELLNEKGRELAIITARALSDIKFDVAISSPLSRAYETADYSKKE
ncbi:MAG: histidine phosphatase family protein [Lachnospiraceae bacterium]|nr:MAG: histidine phosphatase family protein [Lachnospiraceae bacterium]